MAAVAAILMSKDEIDIAEVSIRHITKQVDFVIVSDNGSSDGTREILSRLAQELPLTVLDDPEPAYYQSIKMTRLAALAADMGAAWVIAMDQDEAWYSPFGRIGDILEQHPEAAVLTADVYDHVATALDPAGVDPFSTMGWRRKEPLPLKKVACRPRPSVTIGQGNHDAAYGTTLHGQLVVRHYPYRSPAQFVKKIRNGAAAYAATDLPGHVGQHWRDYGRLLESGGEEAVAYVFREWFWSRDPQNDSTLIYDPVPS